MLLDFFKKLFTKNGGQQPDLATRRLQQFQHIIEEDDFNAVESARDRVQAGDIEPLIALYWRLDEWPQKRALVEILQDQFHPQMIEMMLDFLRAPVKPGDEPMELAQAIALGFIDERYDRFMFYYHDRAALARDVKAVLRKHGLRAEPLSAQERPVEERPASPPQSAARVATIPPDRRLMEAAVGGDLTAVKQALQAGANINVVIDGGNYDGCSALIMALMRKRFEVADFLIAQGADVNYKRPAQHTPDRSRGQTALWWAANHGDLDLAAKLLEKGADINAADHHGGTPLTTAAGSGQLEMVRFLVAAGADAQAQIYDGRKAFNLAISHGHKKVAEYLLTAGNQDPNEGGSSGYTPLMVAAENGMVDLARVLIRQGADVNAVHPGPGIYVGLRGWTPLIFAVQAGYVRMTKLLIRSGADVNHVVQAGANYEGKTLPERRVIDFATGKRSESILKLLSEAGAE